MKPVKIYAIVLRPIQPIEEAEYMLGEYDNSMDKYNEQKEVVEYLRNIT